MHWDTVNDLSEFLANPLFRYVNQAQGYTKCTLLKTASRIFDPLGIVSPFTVTAKLLFQRLWVLKSPWDEELPEEVKNQCKEWCADTIQLSSVMIPRCVKACLEAEIDTAELHIFSDASLKAYGACAYLRAVDIHGNTVTSLVAVKWRIAPIKVLTLPKLMAAVVGARLMKYIWLSWVGFKVSALVSCGPTP